MKKKDHLIGSAAAQSGKGKLRRFMKLALASSVLTTGIANAVLQDHGPGDPIINFPLWYRDTTNLPLQLCRSTQLAPGGAAGYCFPLPPDPAPAFAGNIGPEAFYMNLNSDVITGAINLRYIAALESAYGTLNPVGAPVKGQEVVFSRIRFTMHVTTGSNCAGDYTVVHPFGTDSFPDVPEGKRALFVTFDKPLGLVGNFDGVLDGDVGPFLQWDDGAGNPLNTTALRAANGLVAPNGDEFIGDPGVQHTFTGSTRVSVDPLDPPGTLQNFVEVRYDGPNTVGTAPTDCNLDGAGHNFFRVTTGALLGQVYTAPIPVPTRATNAVYSRDAAGLTTLDVYATTAPGNQLVVVGAGMPNVQMTEELTGGGAGTKFYHSHTVYNGAPPASVKVMNLTTNPIVPSEIQVTDMVKVSKSVYDPLTGNLCINAHSSDQTPDGGAAALILDGPQGGALSAAAAADCDASFGPKLDPTDLSYQVNIPKNADAEDWITAQVKVTSSNGGLGIEDVITLPTAPDNVGVSPIAIDDAIINVSDTAPSTFNITGNDTPAGLTPIILTQPAKGTVTVGLGGNVTYTPANIVLPADSALSFSYVIKNGFNVSNIGTVSLAIVGDTTQPPVTAADNFVVQRKTSAVPGNPGNTSFTASILSNDKAAKNTILDTGSVQVALAAAGPFSNTVTTAGAAGGTVTVNAGGTVTYVPTIGAAGGTATSFWYRVSSNTGVPSAATRVDVSVPVGAENITISAKYQNNNWTIRTTENAVGWVGTVGGLTFTPRLSCYLVRNNTTGVNFLPAGAYIGSVQIPAAGVIDVVAAAGTQTDLGTVVPTVKTNDTVLIQCASTNHLAAFPSLVNTTNTPTNTFTAK